MEKGRAVTQIKEQRELDLHHASVEPELRIPATMEELQEAYANLSQRMNELPFTHTVRARDGTFFDCYTHLSVPTDDEEFPELNLHLQTGYALDDVGAYSSRESVYLVAKWSVPGLGYKKEEVLHRPTTHTDVAEAARKLGLIEESVTEAEKILVGAAA